jgi:5'-deoxynucleotidase YfbR-like
MALRALPRNYSPDWLTSTDQITSTLTVNQVGNALGKICRYGGQCPQWYSVARHSVLVTLLLEHCRKHDSDTVSANTVRLALMHDAHEIFTGDITRPVKAQLPSVDCISRRLDNLICKRFEVDQDEPGAAAIVERADNLAAECELFALNRTPTEIASVITQQSIVGILSARSQPINDATLWLTCWQRSEVFATQHRPAPTSSTPAQQRVAK